MSFILPEGVFKQHLVALGKTGSGKSSALRVLVEHLLDKNKRVCIIDPKGDWWGLKSSANGKSAGYPVIAFGDFKEPKASDVPINPQSGKHIAELITSGNRPCIIGFRGWMPGQMTDFWLDFAATLFNSSEGELYVVVDEVHNFAPKGKILDPKAGKVLHWTNRLLSEGRGLGMVFLLASQRPQKVHNDTLTCCETLLGMRVVHKADRDAIEDWIIGCGDKEQGKEVLNNLAQMTRGEAYVWSPEIGFGPKRLMFPMFYTFDSFAPPQLQKKVSQSGWSEVNLDAVKEKLAKVIEESKANDPAELKKKVAELKLELAKRIKNVPERTKIVRDDQAIHNQQGTILSLRAALKDARKIIAHIDATGFDASVDPAAISKAMESASQQIVKLTARVLSDKHKQLEQLKKDAGKVLYRIQQLLAEKDSEVNVRVKVTHNEPFSVRPSAPSLTTLKPSRNGSGAALPPGERAILIAAAQFGEVNKDQLSVLTGYKRSSRDAYIQRLREKDFIEQDGSTLKPTKTGVDALGSDYTPLPTGDKLWEYWKAKLPEGERRVLEILYAEHPKSVSKESIDVTTGYKRSTRDAYLMRLGSRRLVEATGRGEVKAVDALFE